MAIERIGLYTGIVTALAVVATSSYYLANVASNLKLAWIRRKLPSNLAKWRVPPEDGSEDCGAQAIWRHLDSFFLQHKYKTWVASTLFYIVTPGRQHFVPNGYAYATGSREAECSDGYGIASVGRLRTFEFRNPLCRAMISPNGQAVIVRVLTINDEGRSHLNILRKLATSPCALLVENHTLPLLEEICLGDVVFGVFPLSGHSLEWSYGRFWSKNSVGDILNMYLQALEGLEFIHRKRIAHRDAFKDNFIVQWYPESMRTMTIPVSRPRVYLIDFEVAVEFPAELPIEDCTCTGYPIGGSFGRVEEYSRPHFPEMRSGAPYDPFKLDVQQLIFSFCNFITPIPSIEDALEKVSATEVRMTAAEVLLILRPIVATFSEESLLVSPLLPDEETGELPELVMP